MRLIPTHPAGYQVNELACFGTAYGPRQAAVLNRAGAADAWQEITAWQGYAMTPLRSLDGLAAAAGVDRIWYKDEAGRFGLGSFKALGGAYAVFRLLRSEIEQRHGGQIITSHDLTTGRYGRETGEITVAAATDGNHGRSVAWGAGTFGCRCVIYIHEDVSPGREAAIAAYGAEVVRIDGNYDDSVRRASEDAARNGWHVVSDTSAAAGDPKGPIDIMQGYTVMVEEALRQLKPFTPTHCFVQAGVGGLAAAVTGHLWQAYGPARPRFVIVEPDRADCLFQSARAGRAATTDADLDTLMAGLASGETSPLAWEVLAECADDFLRVPDQSAADVMRLLATGVGGDTPVVAGESAVAGLAGLLLGLQDDTLRDRLRLDGASRILLFGSEGATDPETYERIVGKSAAAVAAG